MASTCLDADVAGPPTTRDGLERTSSSWKASKEVSNKNARFLAQLAAHNQFSRHMQGLH